MHVLHVCQLWISLLIFPRTHSTSNYLTAVISHSALIQILFKSFECVYEAIAFPVFFTLDYKIDDRNPCYIFIWHESKKNKKNEADRIQIEQYKRRVDLFFFGFSTLRFRFHLFDMCVCIVKLFIAIHYCQLYFQRIIDPFQ